MHTLFIVLVLGVAAGVAYLVASRMGELFCVSIRGGRCLVIRGSVPPRLWREILAVADHVKLQRGTIRAVKRGGAARLVFSGIDPRTQQRLRNAVGSAGLSAMRLSSAKSSRQRGNLGQLLGITWLAWLLTRG